MDSEGEKVFLYVVSEQPYLLVYFSAVLQLLEKQLVCHHLLSLK